MNSNKAKELRSIICPNDPITRKTYRRAKKKYSSLSADARILFLEGLRETFSHKATL